MPSQLKDPQAELERIKKAIAKKFGDRSLHKASESLPVNRLPFVEPQLNYATEGGTGFGRFMGMAGEPNSGKSRIAFELIAQAQQLPRSAEVTLVPRIAYHSARSDDMDLSDDMRFKHERKGIQLEDELNWLRAEFPHGADAVFYNAEMQLDKIWVARLGVDVDRLEVFESTTIEEITEVMQNLYQHYPLHVVDSTSNASSLLSQKQDVGKSLMGVDARQWKVCLRDSMAYWDRERNLGIMIHQLSTNLRTGGRQMQSTAYMRFISRLTLMFNHGKFLFDKDRNGVLLADKPAEDENSAMRQVSDGREVFAKVEKSTICRPFREAGLQWSYGRQEFVTEHELAALAFHKDIVMRSGSWLKLAHEDKSFQGRRQLYDKIIEDQELRDWIICRGLDFTDEK